MQGQVLFDPPGKLQTRLIDISESGILLLYFTPDGFTNGEILIIITSSW